MSGGVPRPAGGTVATEATTLVVTTLATPASGGLSGGAIAGIVIGCVAVVLLLVIMICLLRKILQDSNKNHGVYHPQQEENRNVQNQAINYLPPPNVEGLI
ncbi:hypothetical protein L596_020220 [Steinernema carpocapsae]|uniref:Uncharacterized protein n=1 Tax=Steinernema carpocapsae TaxID=34508 RepID=A0A4V6A0U3_STECR|nr:hypothetical protein L596_020220 [Steinernema carpocapsae]